MTSKKAAIATVHFIKSISIGIRHLSNAVVVLADAADDETKAAVQAIFQNLTTETEKLKTAMGDSIATAGIDDDSPTAGFYL